MNAWQPPVDYPFEGSRPALGDASRVFRLGGLTIRMEGLGPAEDQFIARRFRRYLQEDTGQAADLQTDFKRDLSAPYLSETGPTAGQDYRMSHAVRGRRVYHVTLTRCARLDLDTGRAIVLSRPAEGPLGFGDPLHMAVENLLRCFLAWTVLLRGGFMLHAASVVRDGRCYLFFGNSGAGKSTIASICGGQVISDDLTLILPSPEGFVAVGSPFRGTYTACEDLTGAYPVAGLYRLVQDTRVFLEEKPAAIAFGDFLANLPFVVGEVGRFPEAWGRIQGAFEKVQIRYLHFRRDPSFWQVVAPGPSGSDGG